MSVFFYTAKGKDGGMVNLYFSSPPQYILSYCMPSRTNFLTDLPSETDKVWTISLKRTSSEIRVVVYCNNKEVVNDAASEETCTHSSWNYRWSREVGKIKFSIGDEASDSYRAG